MESKPTFDKFETIAHMPLRVFNRTVLMANLQADHGRHIAEEYGKLFKPEERQQIFLMTAYILQNGYEKAKEFATKDFVPEEDEKEVYIEIDGLTA